jgi:hypothetical protein
MGRQGQTFSRITEDRGKAEAVEAAKEHPGEFYCFCCGGPPLSVPRDGVPRSRYTSFHFSLLPNPEQSGLPKQGNNEIGGRREDCVDQGRVSSSLPSAEE